MKFAITLVMLFFSACGTSQDLTTNATVHIPPDTTNPTYYQTQGYISQITTVNVDKAWDYIRTNISAENPGNGSKILLIDSGVLRNHSSLSGKIDNVIIADNMNIYGDKIEYKDGSTYSTYESLETTTPYAGKTPEQKVAIAAAANHGTGVAGILVGNKTTTPRTTAGIAFGAKLDVIQVAQQNDSITTYDGNLIGLNDLASGRLDFIMAANSYNIVNMSFGGNFSYTDDDNKYYETFKTMMSEAIAHNVLITVATGNNDYKNGRTTYTQDYKNPLSPAIYAANSGNSTTGMILAVTGDTILYRSEGRPSNEPNINFCGRAALYCLAAPNMNIVVPTTGTDYTDATVTDYLTNNVGTSYSAPIVAGAAAVMRTAFPSLSIRQIGNFILRGAVPKYLETSSIAGAYTEDFKPKKRTQGQMGVFTANEVTASTGQVSSVYGYGVLDLLASVKLANNTTVSGSNFRFSDSTIYASPILSQALQNSNALNSVQTYDEYDTYSMSFANSVKSSPVIDVETQISGIIMQGKMQNINNNTIAGLGNFGYISGMNIMPQHNLKSGLSYTNQDVNSQMMYLGIDPTTSSSLSNSNVTINKQFGGISFGFQENYRPYNQNIVKNLSNFDPYLVSAFSNGNAKQVKIGTNFGGISLEMQTVFGESKTFTNLDGANMTPSTNLATTASVNIGNGSSQLGFEAGMLRESRSLLGSYSSGALGLGQNNSTIFSKIKTTKNLFGNTNFVGAVSFGQTTTQNPDGVSLFSDISPIISRSFVAGINTKFLDGNVEFTYSQPLAILGGGAIFNGLNRQFISFKTTSFEEDFGLAFQKSSQNSSFSLQMLYIQNRGNINSQNTFGGVLRFTKQL